MKSSEVYAYHFKRMWDSRHESFTLPNGHKVTPKENRENLRQNIGSQRRFRERGD